MAERNVIRSDHSERVPYVRIANAALQDKRLSFRAKGVLAYVLSRPDGWCHSAEKMARESGGEGRDAIIKAINELIACGYGARTTRRNEKGQMETHLKFFELPTPENPLPVQSTTDTGNSGVGPTPENQAPVTRHLENRALENRQSVSQASLKRMDRNECEETNGQKREGSSAPQEPLGSATALRSRNLNSFSGKNWPTILKENPALALAWRSYVAQWAIQGKDEEFIRISLIKRALYAGMPLERILTTLNDCDYGGVVVVKACKEWLCEDAGRTAAVPAE